MSQNSMKDIRTGSPHDDAMERLLSGNEVVDLVGSEISVFIKNIKGYNLTAQQMKTLRGQALVGDLVLLWPLSSGSPRRIPRPMLSYKLWL